MEPITHAELRQFAPHARDDYIDALVSGSPDIADAGITTPLRLCEFLAQVAHETGGFTIVVENMNYKAGRLRDVWPDRFSGPLDPRAIACAGNPERLAEAVYGGRLGNVDKGDGFRYRGRGCLQDTGRDCYREYGRLIGVDLESKPELLEHPGVSLKVACARWRVMKLNAFADRHYTRAIGNAINRGNPFHSRDPIGHVELDKSGKMIGGRMYWFARAWAVFGTSEEVATDAGIALGAHGVKVEILQNTLRGLGYQVGTSDKMFGPALARAVASFKHDHKQRTGESLEPDEIVGPMMEHALDGGTRVAISQERKEATVQTLIAAGSTEVMAGKQQQKSGTLLAVLGAGEGVRQVGGFDQVQQAVGWVPSAHSFMIPVIDSFKWAYANAFWVVVIVGGVWAWDKGRRVIEARLAAHRSGANLGR